MVCVWPNLFYTVKLSTMLWSVDHSKPELFNDQIDSPPALPTVNDSGAAHFTAK